MRMQGAPKVELFDPSFINWSMSQQGRQPPLLNPDSLHHALAMLASFKKPCSWQDLSLPLLFDIFNPPLPPLPSLAEWASELRTRELLIVTRSSVFICGLTLSFWWDRLISMSGLAIEWQSPEFKGWRRWAKSYIFSHCPAETFSLIWQFFRSQHFISFPVWHKSYCVLGVIRNVISPVTFPCTASAQRIALTLGGFIGLCSACFRSLLDGSSFNPGREGTYAESTKFLIFFLGKTFSFFFFFSSSMFGYIGLQSVLWAWQPD